MSSGDTSARSEKPATHPILEKAKQEGSLSEGSLEMLASPQGIPLAGTRAPVILIVPSRPRRNVKYHVPEEPPRLTRDADGKAFFEGGEHTAIGDSAVLHFEKGDHGKLASKVLLGLPSGISLTYGQIVALGGDFYGIPDAPISDGATPEERIDRFIMAYNMLAQPGDPANQAIPIINVMQKEIDAVNEALAQGKPASTAYEALGDTLSKQWNVITGGGSWISDWYPLGRYLQLSATNWDHFGEHAIMAYQAGHTVALRQAVAARSASGDDPRKFLCWAYAMDAFACHFLSDVFSAGHIRSPRKHLTENVKGPAGLGGLLTRAMHDEDSHWGLAVHNARKDSWRAFGDKRYFDTVDLANKAIVDAAVQDSVDEVFDAFLNGTYPTKPENYRALARVADLEKASDRSGAQAAGNISPLFSWDCSRFVVLRRTDVNNLNDYSWTSDWWGWSTLADLQWPFYEPDPPQDYPLPPTGSPEGSPNETPGREVCYAASFVNKLYESDPGPWGLLINVAPLQSYLQLTGVPTGPAGTTSRRIYRRFNDKPYTYAGEITDNTTTTFVDMLP